MKLISILNFY